MTIAEKVAHLKGVMEGMELDASTKEGKLFTAIADILDDMAMDIADLQDSQEQLSDYVDEIDYDLGDVEEELFGEDDEYDDYDEDEDDEEFGCDFVEAVCPDCKKTFCFEADADPDDVVCPHCGGHFTCICQCDEEGADCATCIKTSEDEE